jgi:hypothetical protein
MRTFPVAFVAQPVAELSISIDAWNFSLLHLPAGIEELVQINSTRLHVGGM